MGKVHYQLVTTYYKLMRKLRNVGVQPSSEQLRASADALALLNPMPMGTNLKMTALNGVPTGEISYRSAKHKGMFMFIHGGGFAFCSVKTHRSSVAYLCRITGMTGFIPEYRLTPEHAYPVPINDCIDAYKGLLERHPNRPIHLFGDSAGASLAAGMIHRMAAKGIQMPASLILMSPWLDLRPESESIKLNNLEDSLFDKDDLIHYSKMYLVGEDPSNIEVSPVLGDVSYFPPTLIQVAKNELLYPDSLKLAEKLKKAGVFYKLEEEEQLFHSWQLFPDYVPEARESLRKAERFIEVDLVQAHANKHLV